MRVVTIVPLPPGPHGGVEDYAYSVVRHLADRVSIEVIAPCARHDTVEALEGVPCRLVPATPLFRRRWPRRGPSRKMLRSSIAEADVVHVHVPAPRLERWAAELASSAQRPLLVTYHMDAIYDAGRDDARASLFGRGLQAVYDLTSAVPALDASTVIVTNAMGYARESRLLRTRLDKVRVVRQGVDPKHTCSPDHGATMRARLGIGSGKLIVFLGRLVPYKGVPYAIKAIRALGRPDVRLAIAGSGPARKSLEELVAREGLGDRVSFLGFVPDSEVADLLSAADAVVCPSISLAESTPIVLLEALACGTPTIGTRVGGSAESLPDDDYHGKLVPPRDTNALADAIASVLEANPWTQGRPPAYNRSWKEVADDYLAIFRSLTHG